MAHKAKHGDKGAAEYRAYYDTGYKTDVDRILITGKKITFFRGKEAVNGDYEADGHEIGLQEAIRASASSSGKPPAMKRLHSSSSSATTSSPPKRRTTTTSTGATTAPHC